MVLGTLLGVGDPLMARAVKHKFHPKEVLLVGLPEFNSAVEDEIVQSFDLAMIKPWAVAQESSVVLKWLKENRVANVAIHLDLDVLDPARFNSQLTNDPFTQKKFPTPTGKLDLKQITRPLVDISVNANSVGLTFAEYMPWDALDLQKMMQQLPIMQ